MPPPSMQYAVTTRLMQQAIGRILLFDSGQDTEDYTDERFWATAHASLLDPQQFRAGNIMHDIVILFRLSATLLLC